MRPRRHIFHHNEPPPIAPPYQSLNQSANLASSSDQSMAPPPPLPMGSSAGQSTTPPTDLIAELIRLGLNPDDMMSAKQSTSSNSRQHDDIVKNLQTLLGKRDVAELLQKLQAPNDWSMTPSDYSRVVGGGGASGNPGNRDSVIRGPTPMFVPAGVGDSGVDASGAISFTNNITNNGNSSRLEQDLQYSNAQQHHQAPTSAISHHQQQFRIPTTNNSTTTTTMQNSPFMRNQQSLSQHNKSVLSLHHHHHQQQLQQQQQQQQQNDPSYRHRLNHHQQQQQHKLNAAPNISFTNLSDLSVPPTSSAATAAASGSNSSTILDTSNNPSIFSHHTNKTSPALSSYTIASGGGMTPRVPTNLMDVLSGSASSNVNVSNTNGPTPGIDINMHDTPPFQLSGSIINNRDNMKQKSIAKHHQHLRGQLKANNDKLKNYPWPNQQNVSSSSLSHSGSIDGADILSNQHSRPNNSNSGTIINAGNISQTRRQLTSPLASAITPPQVPPPLSVPKSVLNLAAFSTSPPSSNNINAMISSTKLTSQVQVNRNPAAVNPTYNYGGDFQASNNRLQPMARANSGSGGSIIQKASPSSSSDNNNRILQQMISRSSSSKSNTNVAPVSRTNYSSFSLSSLLSDDQSSSARGNASNSNSNNGNNSGGNGRTVINQPSNSNTKAQNQTNQQILKRPPSTKGDEVIAANPESRKDAYLAYLQERAAKAGISIGEMGSCNSIPQGGQVIDPANLSLYDQGRALATNQQQNSSSITTDVLARREIESALSRVEGRNDLSLLYPPVSLSNNSQKQINSLSAGLQLPEDVDVFTDELKRIVQEGCNIIYECKTCCNLFRSLANLVKHKRTYCKDTDNEANQFELTRRTNMSAVSSIDLSVTKSHQGSSSVTNRPVANSEGISARYDSQSRIITRATQADTAQQQQQPNPAPSLGSQKYNLRGKRVDVSPLTGDMRAPRQPARGNQDHRYKDQSQANISREQHESQNSARQTNLSRLLQSQPRSRPPQMKDSALMDALSVGSASVVAINNSTRDSRVNNMGDIYQEHVRNSSLAKTLLSESARAMNVGQAQVMAIEPNNNMQSSKQRVPLPKRKLLEDCIKKVKRDKLGPGETQQGTSSLPIANQLSESEHQFRDPLDMDDSSVDSDALVMDLDESYPMHGSRRKSHSRSQGRAASSSLSALVSQSNSKLNSSSALLKALTRPVESRPNFGATGQKLNEKQPAKPATADDEHSLNDPSQIAKATSGVNQPDEEDNDSMEVEVNKELAPRSPILDKFFCDSCNIDFEDHSTLFEHVLEQHKTTKKIHPCIFCSLSFITMENVCRHIIDIHKKSKAQVSRLKDVVQSRSFTSDDFANCDDLPSEFRIAMVDSKLSGLQGQTKSRLTPDALSDSAATQQILDDTVALVSMAASPTKSISSTSSPPKRTPAHVTRSASRLAAESNLIEAEAVAVLEITQEDQPHGDQINVEHSEEGSQTGLEVDDRLSDSMIPSISDEQLEILEREEAEIEAELRKREQETSANCVSPSGEMMLKDQETNADEEEESVHVKEGGEEDRSMALQPASSLSQDVEKSNHEQNPSVPALAGSCNSEVWRDAKQPHTNRNDVARFDQQEEPEDSHLTRSSSQGAGRVSRGKQMVPPVRRASDDEDDEDDDEEEEEEEDGEADEDDDYFEEDHEVGRDNDDDQNDADANYDDEMNEVESEEAAENDRSWSIPDEGYANYKSDSSSQLARGGRQDEDDDDNDDDNDDDDDDIEGDDDLREEHVSRIVSGHRSSRHVGHMTPSPRRRASHGSATKGDPDLSSSEAGDKTANYEYGDVGASHSSTRASSRATATLDTPTGAATTSKSKIKNATRDSASVCVSSASSSGGGAGGATPGSGSSGGGGGIMKLKIQLKKQPDEKSKVYRIVE